jgi:hypothetical protein
MAIGKEWRTGKQPLLAFNCTTNRLRRADGVSSVVLPVAGHGVVVSAGAAAGSIAVVTVTILRSVLLIATRSQATSDTIS